MASITVKNIPADLYERLKQRAKVNHRSINSEIIICIEEAVLNQRLDLRESTEGERMVKEKTKGYQIVKDDFSKAILGGTEIELVGERKQAFYRLVAEIVEDLLLANAIQEGEGTEEVGREDIFQILGGEA